LTGKTFAPILGGIVSSGLNRLLWGRRQKSNLERKKDEESSSKEKESNKEEVSDLKN
jgi:hypothetical protein